MQPIEDILFASARASAGFALCCLEPYQGHLRAVSSFVTPDRQIMHWHDFGDLEGPGWAANAVGGSYLLYQWGCYVGDTAMQAQALALLDHVLEDGFVDADSGFIWPYYELAEHRFCLNYVHKNDWLAPGSLARIGTQLLQWAALVDESPEVAARVPKLRAAAAGLADWLAVRMLLLPNGWVPRRITLDGQPYPLTPGGEPDPIFDHSADGLFVLEFWVALTAAGLADRRVEAVALADAFVAAGGFWGSMNHDTYDDQENVAYAVAFRTLRQAAALCTRPDWVEFAFGVALPGVARFRMEDDRHGVATTGLHYMEDSWNTAYLWENAEVALAYLEAWAERGDPAHRDVALGILSAIAHHHYGAEGFLTEGVDWDNHVSQQHHIGGAFYGAIRYTEPLLNNLHLLAPTQYYLERIGYDAQAGPNDAAALVVVAALSDLPACRPVSTAL